MQNLINQPSRFLSYYNSLAYRHGVESSSLRSRRTSCFSALFFCSLGRNSHCNVSATPSNPTRLPSAQQKDASPPRSDTVLISKQAGTVGWRGRRRNPTLIRQDPISRRQSAGGLEAWVWMRDNWPWRPPLVIGHHGFGFRVRRLSGRHLSRPRQALSPAACW